MTVLGPIDGSFADAVHQASAILDKVAIELREASEGPTAALIAYLRSDKPLGTGEREFIADLLAGVMTIGIMPRSPGRPRNDFVKVRRLKLLDAYKKIRAQGASQGNAWRYLASGLLSLSGPSIFDALGFKPKEEDAVEDLAHQLAEWNARPASRK